MKDLTIRFTETAEEEVNQLVLEMGLVPLAQVIGQSMDNLPPELKEGITKLLNVLLNMFSADLPSITGDPEETLRTVSREINLGRLLKERGLFRFYRLLEERIWVNPETGDIVDKNFPGAVAVPLYQTANNPNTGTPFANDNEFIGWFCQEAHVARGLVFRRIMAIRRMVNTLGFTLDESFRIIVSKPYAIEETIRQIAEWDKDDMKNISPKVALALARNVAPSDVDDFEQLVEQVGDDPHAMEQLIQSSKPVVADLLREVALHERAKDAMDMVRHDILRIPEIGYRWDPEGDCLVVTITTKSLTEDGTEYIVDMQPIPFIADTPTLPKEVRDDLVKRLPIKNRHEL